MGLAVQVGIEFFPHTLALLKAQGEEAGFHFANTVEAPAGDDHVFDQDFLGGSDGLVFGFEGGAELLKIDLLFDSRQNDFGGVSITLHLYGMNVDFTDRRQFDPARHTMAPYKVGGTTPAIPKGDRK